MADTIELNNYVRIVNKTARPGEYHLGNGVTMKCGPMVAGLKINKTPKFLREHLTPFIKSLETKGSIVIEPASAVEV